MAHAASNKKFVTLDGVRVSYRPKDNTIHITSTDEDLVNEGFHLTLTQGSESEKTLRKLLVQNGVIDETKIAVNLPKFVQFTDETEPTWFKFPLGRTETGELAWDVNRSPNAFITGSPGSGKTVLIESIIDHCENNPQFWKIISFDFVSPIIRESETRNYVTSVNNAVTAEETIKQMLTIMSERYEMLEDQNAKKWLDVTFTPEYAGERKNVMLIIDECDKWLQTPYGSDVTQQELGKIFTPNTLNAIIQIARKGRKVGIHLVLSTHSPAVVPAELRSNLLFKVSLGEASRENSHIMFGSDAATKTERLIGRGIACIQGALVNFQTYYSRKKR